MAIFISEDLWLSGGLDDGYINANNPRIGYHNLVRFGGVTADTEEPQYPAYNIANEATNLWWQAADDEETHVYFSFQPAVWNYFGIAGHNLSGAIYQMQWRADEGDPWQDVIDEFSPGDNSAIMHLFENIVSGFARLKIIPAAGVPPKIAVVYIGEYLTLPSRVYVGHEPINYAEDTTVASGFSERGDFLGRVQQREILSTTLEQKNCPPDYWRTHIRPFAISAKLRPFFMAWRPAEYPDEIGFCWLTSNIKLQNAHANGFVRFDINVNALAPWPEENPPDEEPGPST